MSTVEPVDRSSASRSPEGKERLPDSSAGLFAAVFQSARLSASRMVDAMTRQAGGAKTSSRVHRRVADALSESGRRDALKRKSEGAASEGPGRVDRLRSMVDEDGNAAGRIDRASEQQADRGVNNAREQSLGADRKQLIESNEQSQQEREAPMPADGAVEGNALLRQDRGEAHNASGGKESPSADRGSNATPQPARGVSEPVPTGATVEAFNRVQPGESTSSGLTAGADQQNHSSGRGTGSGQSQDATQTGAASKAGGTSGRASSASVDFQNVLQAVGRVRGQSTGPRSLMPSVATGTNPAARGINLSESRGLSELARVVRADVGSRHSTMMLRLDPPELGQLRIDVRMHDQMLTLRIEAQTQAGHEALQARLDQLKGTLEQQGIHVNRIEVELRAPVSPAGETQDPNTQQHSTPEGNQSGAGGAQGQSGEGGGSHAPGGTSGPEETTGIPGGDELPEDEEYDGIERPAETGVDLVV